MNSPYQLLSQVVLELESHPEVQSVLNFAKEVVDRFYSDLRNPASASETYTLGFLLVSFDKVTLGNPPTAYEKHIAGTSTGKVARFMCFPDTVTAEDVLGIFTSDEMEVQTALMMLLVSLRQLDVEGPSHMANYLLDENYTQLKGVLARALFATE